jgi:DNA polymerase-1
MKKDITKKVGKRDVYMLIDSHALIHRAYHALPYLQTKEGIPSGALFGLINILLGAIDKFQPKYIFAANDLPKTTFREMAFKNYKAHRTQTEDFLVEQIIRMPELFKSFGIPLLSLEGYEADDVIGTLVKKISSSAKASADKQNYQIVILTGDMDIMQLIDDDKVVVYTAKKGEENIIFHEGEVVKKYGLLPKQIPDYKGLRGDTSDNIPGIKGIGEKTALQILQKGETLDKVYELISEGKEKDFFGITERMFELLKNGKEDAEFSRELATINCDIDIDVPASNGVNGHYDLKEHVEDLKNYAEEYNFLSVRKKMEKLEGLASGRDEGGEVVTSGFAELESPSLTPRPSPLEKVESVTINFSPENFKKVQIALWLLDSSETNIDEVRANYLVQKIPLTHSDKGGEEQIMQLLEQELKKKNLYDLYVEMELPLIEILNEANRVGIKVDREKLQILLQKYEKEKEKLVAEIYKLAGREFNINSPKQMGEVLFEELKIQDNPASAKATAGATKLRKTKGGKISTNAAVLETMIDNHEIVRKILDYREKEKMINTYLEPLLTHSTFDNRIHTTFIQTGAATGRFASTNPNMQNIPVKGEEGTELRKCFIASPGKVFISADYSQIELRVAGILSGDPYLIETYKKGEDIHTAVAMKMFNKSASADGSGVTKDERNAAKAMNFGIFYGMGVNSIKNTLKVERNVAQAFYDSYTQALSVLMKYLRDTVAKTKDTGFTETLYGRERQVKELFSNIPMIRAQGERIAMNAPIQGTAADILKWAMVDFHAVCLEKGWSKITPDPSLNKEGGNNKVDFLLQIHDELLFEVDEEMKDEVCDSLVAVMEGVIKNHQPKIPFTNIPIVANIKSGKNWGEM